MQILCVYREIIPNLSWTMGRCMMRVADAELMGYISQTRARKDTLVISQEFDKGVDKGFIQSLQVLILLEGNSNNYGPFQTKAPIPAPL